MTEKDHTGDTYLIIDVSGSPSLPGDLQERIRLDKQIKQAVVQSA
ncbi:MAG: hypothetical protein R6V45_09250 [Oceanipulchritudo sp.]